MARDVLHNTHMMNTGMMKQPHTRLSDSDVEVPLWSPQVAMPLQSQSSHADFNNYDQRSLLDRELEMELEESDNTMRRHEEAAMRVSEHKNPFSSSKLQPFHQMSEESVDATMRLYRSRAQGQKQFVDARQAANLRAKPSPSYTKTTKPTTTTTTSAFDPRATGDDQWKVVKEQADIRVYRHLQRRGKTTTMMAQGLIHGSLAEIMDGLYAETTKEARVLYALLSDKFLDTSVLHVDSYRTAQHPFQFSGVTWMAMETPRGYGMCKDRDFLCFKKMGTFKDPESGDEIGFLTLLSVDQSEATSPHFLRASSKAAALFASSSSSAALGCGDFVRGFLSVTVFFKKLPNGLVSMFLQGDFNARGHLASRLADKLFADLVFALANAAKCGQAKSLAMLLQSISAGQLPPGGLVAGGLGNSGGGQVSHLLPLLSERNRYQCGVCSKTLWKVIERPEFCRSCWARTCRQCHVTMPIYCADYHRAHGEEDLPGSSSAGAGCGSSLLWGSSSSNNKRKKRARLPKPCKETFCLKCVCSVVPNGIKMNAKLLQQTAKKKKCTKTKHSSFGGGGAVTDRSLVRRRGAAAGGTGGSSSHGRGDGLPSVVMSVGCGGSHFGSGGSRSGSSGSRRRQRTGNKLYVQIPRPHGLRGGGRGPSQFDDHLSISVLSSVESEKLQRQRLSLNNKTNIFGPPPKPATKPTQTTTSTQMPTKNGKNQMPTMIRKPTKASSMLEELENFQLSHMTTTSSVDLLENEDQQHQHQRPRFDENDGTANDFALPPYPLASSECSASRPPAARRLLQLRVNVTPFKKIRASHSQRSSVASSSSTSSASRHGSTSTSSQSKRTNAASSAVQSPNAKPQTFDDAYYHSALQRYLDKQRHRRTSGTGGGGHGVQSCSTRSMDDLDHYYGQGKEEKNSNERRAMSKSQPPPPPMRSSAPAAVPSGNYSPSAKYDFPSRRVAAAPTAPARARPRNPPPPVPVGAPAFFHTTRSRSPPPPPASPSPSSSSMLSPLSSLSSSPLSSRAGSTASSLDQISDKYYTRETAWAPAAF